MAIKASRLRGYQGIRSDQDREYDSCPMCGTYVIVSTACGLSTCADMHADIF